MPILVRKSPYKPCGDPHQIAIANRLVLIRLRSSATANPGLASLEALVPLRGSHMVALAVLIALYLVLLCGFAWAHLSQ